MTLSELSSPSFLAEISNRIRHGEKSRGVSNRSLVLAMAGRLASRGEDISPFSIEREWRRYLREELPRTGSSDEMLTPPELPQI